MFKYYQNKNGFIYDKNTGNILTLKEIDNIRECDVCFIDEDKFQEAYELPF